MNRLSTRKALSAALLTATAAGLVVSTAHADTATLSPTSGNATSNAAFSLSIPASAACSGAGSASYTYTSYMIPASADLATYNFVGGTPNPPSGQFGIPLYDLGGTPVSSLSPSPSGQLIDLPAQYSMANVPFDPMYSNLANGAYKIGVACVTPAGALDGANFWEAPITISNKAPSNFNWAFGVPPAAASLTAVGGNMEITGTVTPVTATPAVSGYQVIATPQGGSALPAVNVPAAGPYTYAITGLTNGTTYDVVVVATNGAGSSTSTPVSATPSLPSVTPAPVVTATSGTSPITVSWTPSTGTPLAGATLVSHTVTFVPVGAAPAIAPVTVPAGDNDTDVTGVVGDGYVVSVVGNYSNGQVTPAGTATFTFLNAQVVVQDLTVVRPQGALVLTQRCGVHGSATAYTNALFGPTFPALTATTDADPTGTAPNILPPAAVGTAPVGDDAAANPNSFGTNPVGPLGQQTPAGAADVLFNQYPYPVDGNGNSIATYATNCGINLGTASLITTGPSAGQYFRSTGRIAQLTVVDTRDIDAGWTLNGRMSNFNSGTDSFSGNLLGWVPEVTWDSNPNLDGYDMTVAAGNTRLPVASSSTAGLGDASNSTNTTLANSLAKANALSGNTGGLGMAVMDARINLLIPVSADAGTYKGVLTFTIV